jgi:hypothetical protein
MREVTSQYATRRQNEPMRVVVTRIEPDGSLQRHMVDTAQQGERRQWEDLAARAVDIPTPYRPAPGVAVYHVSVDDDVVIAAEPDLAGPLLDLVTAVMALGVKMLRPAIASSLLWPGWYCRAPACSGLTLLWVTCDYWGEIALLMGEGTPANVGL